MGGIRRFSSRRQQLGRVFLAEKLRGAKSYRRIAGYFRSSIFELVGEEIAHIPDVRIVCNSELDAADIAVSKAARETALKGIWNIVPPDVEALLDRERYRRLYDLLTAGNVQVRVVPKDTVFLHGKAGVIESESGKTSFLGSINETRSAFAANYEILWEDPSPEGVAWVEEEFDALWEHAHPLTAARSPSQRQARTRCLRLHWPSLRCIAEANSSNHGNGRSSPCSCSTARPTVAHASFSPTRWGWARRARLRPARWSPRCSTTVPCSSSARRHSLSSGRRS